MEEKKNQPISFAERISKILKATQQEVEELAVQFSLGKAEAALKFEEIKKEFNAKSNEWKNSFVKTEEAGQDAFMKMKGKLEELQLQLSLGKAEGKELFEEQRKKIVHAIHDLQNEYRSNPEWNEKLSEFNEEVEKFKLKLEMLKMKFEDKSFQVKEGFQKEMLNAKIEIDQFLNKAEEKFEKAGKKYSNFSKEISSVYNHLKNAVKKL